MWYIGIMEVESPKPFACTRQQCTHIREIDVIRDNRMFRLPRGTHVYQDTTSIMHSVHSTYGTVSELNSRWLCGITCPPYIHHLSSIEYTTNGQSGRSAIYNIPNNCRIMQIKINRRVTTHCPLAFSGDMRILNIKVNPFCRIAYYNIPTTIDVALAIPYCVQVNNRIAGGIW
ncbi:MAG: hypothetical protein C5S38_07265 [Candidatus Methanophagaceae archaeon]|nr:MAG: hypothetical protein C5S38_07265 [Methanophagales archaeon]